MKNFAILLLMLPAICLGDPRITDTDTLPNESFIGDETPWKEFSASLPAYPKEENLIPVNVSSATRNRFMIDSASVSVGKDKIVRYTIVIESSRGARTVNFEGLRCDTAERKIYAFGQPDGKWTENTRAAWERIKFRSPLSYHQTLFDGMFCELGIPVRSTDEAVIRLKREAGVY